MKQTVSGDYRRAVCIDPLLLCNRSDSLDLPKLLKPIKQDNGLKNQPPKFNVAYIKKCATRHADKLIANLPEMMRNSEFYFGAELMEKWLTHADLCMLKSKQEPTVIKWQDLVKEKGMEDLSNAADEIAAAVNRLNGRALDENLTVGNVTKDSKAAVKKLLDLYSTKFVNKNEGSENVNEVHNFYVHGRTLTIPFKRMIFGPIDQDSSFGSVTVKTHLYGKFGDYIKAEKYRKFIVSKYTLSINDSYDFEGGQSLGYWSLSRKKYSLMGWLLSNSEFRIFRRRWGIGKDFDVIVPRESFILPKPIELRINQEEK